jgi:hypothetical protein
MFSSTIWAKSLAPLTWLPEAKRVLHDGLSLSFFIKIAHGKDGLSLSFSPIPRNYFDSVILCLFTTFESPHIPARMLVFPDETNGLKKNSYVMTEKLITINQKELGESILKNTNLHIFFFFVEIPLTQDFFMDILHINFIGLIIYLTM